MKSVIGLLVVAAAVFAGIVWYANRGETGPAPLSSVEGAPAAPAAADPAAKAAEALKQAKVAAAEGNAPRARALFEQIAKESPDTWAGREAELELGNLYLRAGMKREAVDAFRKGLPNATEAQNPIILATVRQIEAELTGTPPPTPTPTPMPTPAPTPVQATPEPAPPAEPDTVYVVVKGDTLTSIARKFKVSIEQLMLANRRTDDKLSINDRLTISRDMPAVTVSKKGLKLTLAFKGATVKEYPVCIGKEAELTPAGAYTVGDKIKNPPWYQPGGKKIPYGDPANILGTRWMTLISGDGVRRGYGIHGTTMPETVPGRASAGCIRMLNADVEQLYEWVPPGTKVTITEE